MKVKELIKLLLDCDPNAKVLRSLFSKGENLSPIEGIKNVDNRYIVIYQFR